MATRRVLWTLIATLAMTAGTSAATKRTPNFIVETARPDDAEEFARLAEHYRREKAIEWLGREMPQWREPCRLRVTITGKGAGGATTFNFEVTPHRQEMHIEGARERLKNSVLPHEVTHTVFAHHFRQPVPRWADEGGSVYSEDDLERSNHDKMCKDFLNAGRGIQLRALFRMKEYPRDVMVLYAQGYSVSKYLIEKSDRQAFLNFVAAGMDGDWDRAAQDHYGFKNVADLEANWIDHLKRVARGEAVASNGRPAPRPADGRLTAFDSAPPARPTLGPTPEAARGLAPTGPDRTSSEIGWNRPRAVLLEVEPGALPRLDPKAIPTNPRTAGSLPAARPTSPSAILLPPEPAPSR